MFDLCACVRVCSLVISIYLTNVVLTLEMIDPRDKRVVLELHSEKDFPNR